jgi:outer membrane biosynthesis protein TonB
MRRGRKLAVVLLALLVLLSGCTKKKVVAPAPQEQAPTIAPAEEHPTEAQQPPSEPQPIPPLAGPPAATPPKSKPRKSVIHKTVPKPAPEPENKPSAVQEGGTPASAPQLAADLPRAETIQQQQTTVQLQAATEANLRAVTRALSDDEKAMTQQIRAYLQQSRSATTEGDTERAYNLAYKAHLLSRELVKR